jgi:hypothetical protein
VTPISKARIAAILAIVAGLVTALASCGGGNGGSASSPEQPQKSNRATASEAPRRCTTNELRIVPAPGGAATGHSEIPYAIFNQDHRRCSLYGFPRITLLGPGGKPVELKVKPSSHDFFGTVPKRIVIVPEGGLATFRLADSSGPYVGTEKCLKVSRMRVSFPPDPDSKLTKFGGMICPDGNTTVSPVARNRSAYF